MYSHWIQCLKHLSYRIHIKVQLIKMTCSRFHYGIILPCMKILTVLLKLMEQSKFLLFYKLWWNIFLILCYFLVIAARIMMIMPRLLQFRQEHLQYILNVPICHRLIEKSGSLHRAYRTVPYYFKIRGWIHHFIWLKAHLENGSVQRA